MESEKSDAEVREKIKRDIFRLIWFQPLEVSVPIFLSLVLFLFCTFNIEGWLYRFSVSAGSGFIVFCRVHLHYCLKSKKEIEELVKLTLEE